MLATLLPSPRGATAEEAVELDPRGRVAAVGARPDGMAQAGPAFGLQSEAVSGCVSLPARQPPALDCTVIAGGSFVQTVTAWAFDEDLGTPLPLRLETTPPAGARWLAVTGSGERAQPVEGLGRVTGRLRYAPAPGTATPPDQPLRIDFTVVVGEPDEDPTAAPRVTIQTRMHLVSLAADERLAVAYAFDDVDGDGAWAADEPPLPGRVIRLTMPDGSRRESSSDDGGRVGLVGRAAVGALAGSSVLEIDAVPGWRATTPSRVALRFPGLPWAVPFVRYGQREATSPGALQPRLATGRGCLAGGDSAIYRIGEALAVRVRVDGAASAWVRLWMRLPDGSERALVPGQAVGGEAWYRLQGVAGSPPGTRLLRLEAWRAGPGAGPPDATVECDYLVVADADPAIELEPRRLELPAVAPGGASSATVVLRNVGGAPLTVASAEAQGGATSPFSVAGVDRPPFRLDAGEARDLRVVFAPSAEGGFDDYLLVRSDDPKRPLSAVALRGETPGQARTLSATLATDRGCLETGQEPLYLVDDPIEVRYRVDGAGIGSAEVTLELIDAAGASRVLQRGSVAPGVEREVRTSARPPAGEATLRLSVDAGGLLATAECRVRIVAPTVQLAGFVFHDINGNGVWDGGPGGPPVPDAEPALAGRALRLGGPERAEATSGEDGAFAFEVSRPGDYRIEAPPPAGWVGTTPVELHRRVYGFPGERPTSLRFGQRPDTASPAASPTPTALEPTPAPPPTATPEGSDCVKRGTYRHLLLGERLELAHAPACLRLWIPSRFGGQLRVRTEAGRLTLRRPGSAEALVGPSAAVELVTGLDEHGWIEVVVRGAPLDQGVGVRADFRQAGRAAHVPWNTWRWPLSPEGGGPRLYDVPGALSRYDARFGLGDRSLAWERRHGRLADAAAWWGHGWGAALAAATLKQPQVPAGEDWRQDELEGLSASFFEAVALPALAWGWPAVTPRPGPDVADRHADDLQRAFESRLLLRGAPLVADLRQEAGPATGDDQVHPHVVHAFHSTFRERIPAGVGAGGGAPDPGPAVRGALLEVTTVFTANAVFHVEGVSAGGPETTLKRQQEAVYTLRYSPWGEIVSGEAAAGSAQDWRSLRLTAGLRPPGGDVLLPRGLVDPRPAASSFTGADLPRGENPALTSERLGALGIQRSEVLRWP